MVAVQTRLPLRFTGERPVGDHFVQVGQPLPDFVEQRFEMRRIVILAGHHLKVDYRVFVGRRHVNLRGQAPARTARRLETLFLRGPAAC